MSLAVGEVFAGYTIVRRLGSGGMGSVYLAQHPRLPRRDALKVLAPELTADPQYRARFLREADVVASLFHPNILGVHDRGEYNGQLWIAMDYVQGTDAASLLREHYPTGMPPEQALEILTPVAAALDHAHQHGLLHRDVKPANILLTEPDPESGARWVFLADFGIARRIDDTAGLTATNMAVGTVAYAAPEQLMGESVDARADQYALACTAFQLLTGSRPYDYSSAAVVITKHVTSPPPSIGAKRPELAQLDAVFATAMAKRPDDRYPSCHGFIEDLRRRLAPQPVILEQTQLPPTSVERTQAARPAPTPPQQTQFAPTQAAPLPPPAPQPGPRRWTSRPRILVAAGLTVAVLTAGGIFAAVELSRHTATTTPSTPAAPPGPPPNTGPFTGTYAADLGPDTLPNGKPANDPAPAARETWALRSVCRATGCVATASRRSGETTRLSTLVFDDVGGRWIALGTASATCGDAPAERWEVITLQPRPDGSLSGEYLDVSPPGCARKRTLNFTRTGDVDLDTLPDPAGQAPRVASPAEALHGRYRYTSKFKDGSGNNWDFVAGTDCLRNAERCISVFNNPDGGWAMVFANGTWVEDRQYNSQCSSGGTSRVSITSSFALPQPPQDPIAMLTGHGRLESSGTSCNSDDNFDAQFQRTGD